MGVMSQISPTRMPNWQSHKSHLERAPNVLFRIHRISVKTFRIRSCLSRFVPNGEHVSSLVNSNITCTARNNAADDTRAENTPVAYFAR